jgi:hypothetical protein
MSPSRLANGYHVAVETMLLAGRMPLDADRRLVIDCAVKLREALREIERLQVQL